MLIFVTKPYRGHCVRSLAAVDTRLLRNVLKHFLMYGHEAGVPKTELAYQFKTLGNVRLIRRREGARK